MVRRILVRFAVGLVTLWAVSAVVFLGTEALPGDPATAALGQQATPELLAQYRKDFNLDRPVFERYGNWLSGFVRGDLGKSLPSGDPVWKLIKGKVRNTAVLAAATLIFLIPVGVGLGMYSAVRRDKPLDHLVGGTTLALMATPEFVVGTLAVAAFSVWAGLLPPVSLVETDRSIFSQLSNLVLPVLTLLGASVAQSIRMVRACMIDTLRSEYIEVARLKGVPERRVLVRHALPNALGPTIQIFALTFAWLLGGIVVVETIFQYPGLGLWLTDAVIRRDLPMVEAITMLIAGAYVVVNLLADIVVIALNPRLRRADT